MLGSIITAAPEMLKVGKTIERVACADVSVMLLGASGTGKELLARAVHEKSGRKGEFIAINCAAIPENLLEAELFGYERGAFTGAVKSNVGKIELAEGGTLFLDEVGDIPLPLQVKLLRFLQERVIERIGGRQPIAVDTRIVCATHQDLEAMIADGRFREDLYYRLAEIVVKIPSLAERSGDAVLLARHFVNRFGRELNPGRPVAEPRRDRRDRRLRLAGQRPRAREPHQARGHHGRRQERHRRRPRPARHGRDRRPLPINLRAAREVADRKAIRQAMSRTDNNISGAAKLLGISRPTLVRSPEAISSVGLSADRPTAFDEWICGRATAR